LLLRMQMLETRVSRLVTAGTEIVSARGAAVAKGLGATEVEVEIGVVTGVVIVTGEIVAGIEDATGVEVEAETETGVAVVDAIAAVVETGAVDVTATGAGATTEIGGGAGSGAETGAEIATSEMMENVGVDGTRTPHPAAARMPSSSQLPTSLRRREGLLHRYRVC